MLQVISTNEAHLLISKRFTPKPQVHKVPLTQASGCILAADIFASENVPGFSRSSVDGYAVNARDVFGCSYSIPALLELSGEVEMGKTPNFKWRRGGCFYVPTGGELPEGTDAMVMLENAERFSDDTVAIYKPSAPGQHIIFLGDDIKQGEVAALKGTVVSAREIGAFSALGISYLPVVKRPKVGIISTGDELIPAGNTPIGAQIRDSNGPMLKSAVESLGGEVISYGIVKDELETLSDSVGLALAECDMLLITGGTSVGNKDAARQAIEAFGEVFIHGIAVKPGKPTLVGKAKGKPVFGLPGHPLAAYFMFEIFVRPFLLSLLGLKNTHKQIETVLSHTIPSNNGREEYIPVKMEYADDVTAVPILSKSGLITSLLRAHGYICIPREIEGLPKGSRANVILFRS